MKIGQIFFQECLLEEGVKQGALFKTHNKKLLFGYV